MKKRKRSFPVQQNYATLFNSSSDRKFVGSDDDHSTDSTNELSAYEVLLLKRNGRDGIKSSSNKGMTMPLSNDITENGKACRSFMERNGNALVSSFPSKNVDKSGEKMNKMNETNNKERKLIKKETQEGNKRKRKSIDNGELNGSAIAQSQTYSNDSVFSSLFRKYYRSEKMQNLLKHNISDKALQNSGKKGKRKMQKKIQKIVHNGEIVDYLSEEEETEENKVLISDSKDEKFFEVDETGGKEEGMKNRKENSGKFQLHDGIRVSSSFSDDEKNQKGTGDAMIYENFVKCYGTKKNENVHGAIIDFEQKPFSAHSDSIQNGLDAMQWLIDPYDIKQFFKVIFQKKVFYVCRNSPSYYGNLFSTAKFIDILRADYVEYGTNVNVAMYKNQQRSTLNGSGKVYPQEIQKSIKAGCSIQFTNPQSFCDNVWYFCDLLQEVFGCFVGANTYITPANTAGFAPHWDDIDAFLLQLEGRKHWKVYAPINDSEMLPRLPSDNFTDDDMANRTPVFDDWLEQGDLLYIPRGFIHQGFADKDVHSLHLTVSVCRNVTYADLLERVIPLALSSFAEQHVNVRKSLPAGYLDITGVLECNYPLLKTGALKLDRFLNTIFSNFCNYIKGLIESAIDMMAREFMKTALPPMLTKEEKDMTVLRVTGSSLYDDKQHIFTKDTAIKLLRRHGQRLIYESEERCFIVHRMANSRVHEGRPEVLFDIDVKLAEGFANLMDAYPHWCLVSDVKCDTIVDSIRLAELLYSNGLLMAKFSKIV
uniref:Bifunctional lysine-specific demethylase and histidyl-hydroxylase n=1 Tax=Onchocerca volvulus TaxID=6282 RepID=A0A8R1TVM9_ONCVO